MGGGVLINKKLVCSVRNVEEIFYDHLPFD